MQAVTLILASLAIATASFEPNASGYAKWARTHNRVEKPSVTQFRSFIENVEFVRQHNNDKSRTWTAELNQYGDMTAKEFKEKILMNSPYVMDNKMQNHNAHKKPIVKLKDTPKSFDWKGTGAVTPVQDQGFVGTCWAFSTVGNIEGQYYQATNTTMKLSEEYFVDCDGTADTVLNHADCSIFGGWPYIAYQFATTSGGVPTEESYPYCAGTGECYPCMKGPENLCGPPPYYCDREERNQLCSNEKPVAFVKDWRSVSTDETEITSDLYQTGPLSVLLNAATLQHYKSGVWDGGKFCNPAGLDHAVLLTGYGNDDTSGIDYWNIKNSWGPKWGEDGYFRIQRGTGTCGMNTAITTSIM